MKHLLKIKNQNLLGRINKLLVFCVEAEHLNEYELEEYQYQSIGIEYR